MKVVGPHMMTRRQFFELANNLVPISVEEADGGSLLQRFCLGAEKAISRFKDASVHSDDSGNAARAIKKYALNTDFDEVVRFIGNGSSRIVFSLQDGSCLKFAYNKAGISQNRREAYVMQTLTGNKLPCFPKVYEHTDDWRGILTECCTNIKNSDFNKMFGCGRFEDGEGGLYGLMRAIEAIYRARNKLYEISTNGQSTLKKSTTVEMVDEVLRRYMFSIRNIDNDYLAFATGFVKKNNPQWRSLRALLGVLVSLQDRSAIADLESIENWGLVTDKDSREVFPVCLDIGLDEETFNKFYM